MASNTTLNPGASGDIIATKERTHDGDATKVQVVTLAGVSGTEGAYTFGDIGGDATNGLDVDVTRVSGGGVAHDAAATSQNPLTVGGYASAAAPADVSADGDAVRAWMLRNGAQATVITAAGALVGGDATNGLDVDVTRIVPGTGATSLGKAVDSAAGGTDTGVALLAVRDDALTTLTPVDGDYVPLRTDSTGALHVRISGGGVSGVVDDAAFTAGTTELVPMGYVADESSTDSVDEGDIGGARITLDRKQIVTPYVHAAAGGTSNYTALSTAAVLTAEIKGSAGKVYSLECFNVNAAARYVRLYNQTGAPASTDTANVVWQGIIPGATTGGGFVISWPMGKQFSTGIGIRSTTGIAHNDTGALAANELTFNVSYA